jgi:hypothetical protein
MFDFGIAGPLAGLAVSLALLLSGLEMTSSIGLGSQLPVVPVDLLRASSLGECCCYAGSGAGSGTAVASFGYSRFHRLYDECAGIAAART